MIQADEPLAIPHARLRDPRCVVGEMPADFHGRLVNAVRFSVLLSGKQKTTILLLLDATGPTALSEGAAPAKGAS